MTMILSVNLKLSHHKRNATILMTHIGMTMTWSVKYITNQLVIL